MPTLLESDGYSTVNKHLHESTEYKTSDALSLLSTQDVEPVVVKPTNIISMLTKDESVCVNDKSLTRAETG